MCDEEFQTALALSMEKTFHMVTQKRTKEVRVQGEIDSKALAVTMSRIDEASWAADWVSDPNEATMLGAEYPVTAEMLVDTAEQGVLCVAIYYADPTDPREFYSEHVGYAMLSLIKGAQEPSMLLEHVIINPKWRNRRIGTSFIRYLLWMALDTFSQTKQPTGRVYIHMHRDNEAGLAMMDKLPMFRVHNPTSAPDDSNWVWFQSLLRPHNVHFATMVRDLRKQQKLSIDDLADLCGVSRVQINNVELGRRLPSLPLLQHLCHVLGARDPNIAEDLALAALNIDPQ